MATLTLDRPSVTRIASSLFDTVLMAPGRIARAHELRGEVEHVLALSDAQIAEMNTSRDALMRAIAQRA